MLIQLPVPEPEKTKPYNKIPIEERIEDAMCLCESGHESQAEWNFLRKVNNYLTKKKNLNKKQKLILDKVSKFLRQHSSASGGQIDVDSEKVNLFEDR